MTNDKEKIRRAMSGRVLAACVCVFDDVRVMRCLPWSISFCILWFFLCNTAMVDEQKVCQRQQKRR